MGTQGEPLVERVGRVLRESGVGESERLMVGFSGGRDSVALVDLLRLAGWKRLVLCHLDHGLREGSGAEAERVRDWAKQWGVECRVERADLGRGNSGPGGGMEKAGREARYGFFSRVSRELGVARLLLGHHANDQVETFLFRLMRGAGLAGLGG
ncbi:MAG: tRNA(Ile)-lysidine synthase, partial [Verrucomicrobiota bacterium]